MNVPDIDFAGRVSDEGSDVSTVEFNSSEVASSLGPGSVVGVAQTISHYRILSRLGEGGMGVVYKAEDTSLQRPVALKFLRPNVLGSDEHQARFVREAQAAAALDHPNICTIHEIGKANGQTFLAMAYIEGATVSDKIKESPLKLDEALDIAIQAGKGLQAAHEKGIVHRDIKSTNLIVTTEGHVKVMDFGLAQRSDQTRLTKTDAIVGTPACMSPEQVRGQTTDRRTDIWSLGVVLYEMVTGRLPFGGENAHAVLYSIVHGAHEPITTIRAGLPPELDRIVSKALTKNPAQRYQRIDEMLLDLRALRKGALPVSSLKAPPRQARRRILLAGAGLLALFLVVTLGLNVGRLRNRVFTATPNAIKSVAVLPLQNLSGDPEQDYFAEGMTEALTADISKISALKVISRTTAMRYKGSTKPLKEIARELRVDAVVEGSVAREAGKVRVTARLIDAATEQNLWAESYERELTSILALQGEVARDIASKINVTLSPEENTRLAKDRKVSPETYEAYLRGMFWLNKGTPDGIKKGMTYFHEAVEKDPGDAQAYAGLALGYMTIAHGPDPPADALTRARAAAERAVRLDDTLAEAHAALAFIQWYHDHEWETAERTLDHALEINPNLAIAHYHKSWFHVRFDRMDEAIVEHKRAQDLDPLTPLHTAWLGEIYRRLKRYEEAIAEAQKAIEIDPNFPIGHSVLARIYSDQGKHEEAIAESRKAAEVSPTYKWQLGVTYAKAGRLEETRKSLMELEQQKVTPWNAMWRAHLNMALGNKDETFRWLNYEPQHALLYGVRVNELYRPVYDDPRFLALLRRMNLPPP